MDRRSFTAGGIGLTLQTVMSTAAKAASTESGPWRALEFDVRGRLGAAILDTATGTTSGWRLDERFPMCSTFKWLLAAAVLKRVDDGQDRLSDRVTFTRDTLPAYSPTTGQHADAQGMTLAELCEAAVTLSDNGAANLLLARLGGPPAVTRMARHLGDTVTRLDRNEPTLNESRPGDPRDTTSPRRMAFALQNALLGDGLAAHSRTQLTGWLVQSSTGLNRLRAGMPADWRAGDKTGTGARGSTNDVGIFWPPGRPPIIVAAFLTLTPAPLGDRERALAAVGREAARLVA